MFYELGFWKILQIHRKVYAIESPFMSKDSAADFLLWTYEIF